MNWREHMNFKRIKYLQIIREEAILIIFE